MGVQKKYRVRERAHDDLLHDLLAARGVAGDEATQQFLEPDFVRDSHDPLLLPDMGTAVERIEAALRDGERVCVWSDYDCDGIPGGVMLSSFLREIGLDVVHYIPHRHKEGFGLNNEGLTELGRQGVKLVITVDLGTSDVEPIAHAQNLGIDIIVTDHHLPPTTLPSAFAIINPKRVGSLYPFDGVCGAGVAWKLVQGVLANNRHGIPEGREKWYLDLVALATLSDMVPLVGENRMIARYGLVVMRRNRRPGLKSLLQLLRITASTLTEDDIGFMVAPRINAASRMDNPELAAKLLATENVVEAATLAKELNRINDERKGVVASIVKEVNHRIKENPQLLEAPVLVMGNPKWRPGVLGLVANTLAGAHNKPVFLWGREGGDTIRGSVRSDGSTNIVELMTLAHDAFEDYGGHSASGGFSLAEEKVHELSQTLNRAYQTLAAEGAVQAETMIDRELLLGEVPHAIRDLSLLAPFGTGNAKPLFVFPRVSVGAVRMFGKARDHLEVALSDLMDERVAGISFFSTPESFTKPLEAGRKADIVGHVERDWRGAPRIRIVDVI